MRRPSNLPKHGKLRVALVALAAIALLVGTATVMWKKNTVSPVVPPVVVAEAAKVPEVPPAPPPVVTAPVAPPMATPKPETAPPAPPSVEKSAPVEESKQPKHRVATVERPRPYNPDDLEKEFAVAFGGFVTRWRAASITSMTCCLPKGTFS